MGTWNAFYVMAQFDDLNATKAIQKGFPDAEIESSDKYLGIRMPDECFEAPEAELANLSAELETEVLWMGLQSAVDAFIFHHWQNGQHIRSLVYGCIEEAVWERVEGQAEPWEKEVFFDPKGLKYVLGHGKTPAEEQELQRMWETGELQTGRSEPFVDSKDCAHKIARIYGLPHYGL